MSTMVTSRASINFYLDISTPASKSRIVLREWSVVFRLTPDRPGVFLKDPEPVAEHEVYFDYQSSRGGWCWRDEGSRRFLTTAELADHILKLMIDLHEDIERKKSDPDYDAWEDE